MVLTRAKLSSVQLPLCTHISANAPLDWPEATSGSPTQVSSVWTHVAELARDRLCSFRCLSLQQPQMCFDLSTGQFCAAIAHADLAGLAVVSRRAAIFTRWVGQVRVIRCSHCTHLPAAPGLYWNQMEPLTISWHCFSHLLQFTGTALSWG